MPSISRLRSATHGNWKSIAIAVEHEATMATLDGRLSEAARAIGVKVLP